MGKLGFISIAFLLLMGIGLGCQKFTYELPDGFVKLQEDHEYKLRGISTNNSVIGIQLWDNEEEGDLDFWFPTSVQYLIQKKGYQLQEEKEYKTKNNIPGKAALLTSLYEGESMNYLLAIFVNNATILSFEYTAKKPAWETEFDKVEASFRELVVND